MKKVLVISYYWPPSGGGGVQRIAKFCKYLGDNGWEPIVLTVFAGNFPSKDESLTQDVKNVNRVYLAKSWEPHSLYQNIRGKRKQSTSDKVHTEASTISKFLDKLGEHIRLNIFVPDSRIGWYPSAVRMGSEIIRKESPNIILSSAPPYTAHLVAKKLKRKFHLPWVADFRDPWVENHAYNTVRRLPPAVWANRIMENQVIAEADEIVTVGAVMNKLLVDKYPSQKRKFNIVSNGYDERDVVQCSERSSKYYISHFGSLYWRRFPLDAMEVLYKLVQQDSEFSRDFQFRVYGGVDRMVKEYLLDKFHADNLNINEYVPHSELVNKLYQPQLLLLSIDQVHLNQLIVTGKLFEYIASGNPVLGVGPKDGDAAKILSETASGKMFQYNETDAIREYVLEYYRKWKNETLGKGPVDFPKYRRSSLTKKLAEVLEKCAND